MHRTAFALALVGCMVWLTASGAVDSAAQEKVPPTKDVKEDKSKDAKKEAKPIAEKKVVEGRFAVPAMRLAPAQKVEKAAVRKAVKAAPAAPAMNANVIAQQFLPHFQKTFKAELHFMRMVCECNRQQYEKVAADAEPKLKDMAEKFAQRNQNGFLIVNAGMAGQESDDQNDVQLQISQALVKSTRKHLPTELADRYEKEINERLEASKQAVVLAYVAKMDKLLHLTAEQRDRLTKLLDKKWKYSANRARLLTMGGPYFPMMPDSDINEILSAPQKRVWTGIQRGNISFGVSLDQDNEPEIQEKWDEPAKKPAAGDAKASDNKTTPDKAKQP
jgi:hypothetical protein